MKKFYIHYRIGILFLLLFSGSALKAQVSAYTFAQSASTYTTIGSGGTRVTAGAGAELDEGYNTVALPFTFNYNGTGYTSVAVSSNGFLQMGTTATNGSGAAYVSISNNNGQIISSTTAGTFNTISALNFDLTYIPTFTISATKTSGSPIIGCSGANFTATKVRPGMGITGGGIPGNTYIVSVNIGAGTLTMSANATNNTAINPTISTGVVTTTVNSSPNRIFTVQWSGRTRYSLVDDMDFQIKLYETTNVIEIYYNTVAVATTGTAGTHDLGQIGLKGAVNTDFNNRTTTSNWSASTAGGTNTATNTLSAAIKPAIGQLYQWTPPLCMTSVPSALTSSSVFTTTATISWAAASPVPASGYDYYISNINTAPTSATTPAGNTASLSAGLTSLTPGMQYYFWVRGNCGGGKSGWVGSATFTTACVNATLPYTQGFNATTIPACWSQQYVSGSTPIQFAPNITAPTILTPQEGADFVYWNSSPVATSGNKTRLVSVPITTTGATSVNARFYWYHDNSAYTTAGYADEGVILQYSLNGISWTDVQPINRLLPGTDGWTLYDIALPGGAANQATIYVGFQFTSRAGDNCAMDNLLVYAPLPCTTPTDQPVALALTAVTSTSLTATFTAASPAPSGYLVLRSTSATQPVLVNGTPYNVGSSYALPGNSYTVISSNLTTSFSQTGLTPNTRYYYWAFSYNSSCSGQPYYLNASPANSNDITCTAAPATLTGAATGSTTASISFAGVTGASYYSLQYSIAGANAWITASPNPTASPYALTGLDAGTVYDIRLAGPNISCGTFITTLNAFTTVCSVAPLTYIQGFNSTAIAPCWSVATVAVQTGTKISFVTTASNPTTSPYESTHFVQYNSFSNANGAAGSEERLVCAPLNTSGVPSVDVDFYWRNENNTTYNAGAYLNEGVQVQYSTNGGTLWVNAGTFFPRHDGSLTAGTASWNRKVITLPGAAGNIANLLVGFKFHSEYGDNCFIDQVTVKATPPCNYPGTTSASTNTICSASGSAVLTATDYSVNGAGLAYNWQMSTDNVLFNDIAGATNPATYTTPTISATRYYKLRVFCTSLGNSFSNTQTISVGSYSILTTAPASRCGVGTVTLGATSSGGTISWYDAASGGTSVGTGGTFTTPEISSTTTYYVAANSGAAAATIGATYSGSSNNGTSTGSHGIVIKTTSPNIVIVSAKIPFTGKGQFTIQLQTTGGVVVNSVTTPEITGNASIPVTVPLNIAITTPGTYRLLVTAITGTIDELGYIANPVYPYTGLGGAFTITKGYWYGNDPDYYMYLFNLVVTNICEGARVAVNATVTAPPALTISPASATICSGSSTTINVTSPAANFTTYSWSPVTGLAASGSPSGTTVTLNPTSTTNYTLTATSASNCVNKVSALITVNAAPPTTTGAAVCSGSNATISALSPCTNYGNPTLTINGNYDAAADATAPRPIIYIANSPTCNFDPTVIRNYTTLNFQVTVTGTYTFVMPNTTAYDGMGYIVTGAFVPGVCPGMGAWVVGDDDSGPTTFEPFMSATLTAGTTYTLITTTYSVSSGTYTGPYTWNITAPVGGAVTTVSGGTLQWFTTPTLGTSISSASPFNPVGAPGSGIATNTSVGSYTFYAACSNNPTCRTATGYVIGTSGQWIGATNTDWSTTANWCGGVPTIASDASISLGPVNMPILSTGTGTVNNITVNTGATLTVSNAVMQIAGAITAVNNIDASAGTVELKGSTAQAISGSNFTNRSIRNIIASNSVNVSSTANDSLKITGILSFGASSKAFNSGNNVILASTPTGTAMVADITNNGVNSGNTLTGNFQVRRYIPARRAWRLMTAPINAGLQTINQAWQEGQGGTWSSNTKPHFGTHVSGGPARSTSDFFDQGPLYASIYGYTATGWNYLPLNTTEMVTSNQGWMLFIRGSRAINLPLSTPATIPDETILRPTGTVKFGTQPTLTNTPGGYFVVGNPYPAPINFKNITRTGVIGGMGGNNAYTLWDPALGGSSGVGAFVAFAWNGTGYTKSIVVGGGTSSIGINGMIPSSSAFMVNQSAGGTTQIEENDKDTVVYTSSYLFRPVSNNESSLRISLYGAEADSTMDINDGAVILFNSSASTDVDFEDVIKVTNVRENLSIVKERKKLAIEFRAALQMNDTLFYNIRNMSRRHYEFEIALTDVELPAGASAFFEDTYLQQKTMLDYADTTRVPFDITADTGSFAQDRFRIVIVPQVVLPVTFASVKAYEQNQNIVVEWAVQNELNIAQYEVEKSADGLHFGSINTTTATGGNVVYNTLDKNPFAGNNYFRIKSIDNNGRVKYSTIVKVFIGKGKAAVTVYPNPVTNALVNISFANMPAGQYSIKLFNAIGQFMMVKQINHTSASALYSLPLDKTISSGVYQLEVSDKEGNKHLFKLLVK